MEDREEAKEEEDDDEDVEEASRLENCLFGGKAEDTTREAVKRWLTCGSERPAAARARVCVCAMSVKKQRGKLRK